VIDKTKENNLPLRWHNCVTIIHGKKSLTVRRYTAFRFALCQGAAGLPYAPTLTDMRENTGRKSKTKIPVTVQVEPELVAEFGGLRRMQKRILLLIKLKI
jgi:hypothetical protein